MRKLKLQVQLSIDGFNSRSDGALDWMMWNWDDKLKEFVGDLTNSSDTILLGRKMTDGFVGHWTNVMSDPANPEYEIAKKFVETPKVVFTRTLTESPWANTSLATGDIVEEVNKLKSQSGGDIIVYGGSEFVGSLIAHDLIDEYNLFVNPTAIGKGTSIFAHVSSDRKLTLSRAVGFDCGVTLLQYVRS